MIDVDPLVGNIGADVGLVLMVGADDLDLDIRVILHEVLRRQLGGGHRAWAGIVGIKARHVGKHADFDVDLLGTRGAAGQRDGESRQSDHSFH